MPARQGYLSLDETLKRFFAAAAHAPGGAHPRYKALLPDGPGLFDRPDALSPFGGFEEFYRESASLGLEGAERLQYVDFKTFLAENCLVKSDRMSMAHGLEVRVPLLDNAMIDFAAALPGSWHVRGWTLKAFLKKALAQHLPASLVYGKKRGFSPPMARWINGPLAALVDDHLSESRLLRQGLFQPREVARLLREHRSRREEHSRILWALVVLSHWLDGIRVPGRAV